MGLSSEAVSKLQSAFDDACADRDKGLPGVVGVEAALRFDFSLPSCSRYAASLTPSSNRSTRNDPARVPSGSESPHYGWLPRGYKRVCLNRNKPMSVGRKWRLGPVVESEMWSGFSSRWSHFSNRSRSWGPSQETDRQ